MLEDSGFAEPSAKMAERCRPDYESMIRRIKEKLDKAVTFREAALLYLEGRTAKGKMAELIGELVTQCNALQQEHDSLIRAQEGSKEREG